jgi:hypothetical protein
MLGLEFDPAAPNYAGMSARVAKACLDRGMLILPAGPHAARLAPCRAGPPQTCGEWAGGRTGRAPADNSIRAAARHHAYRG